MTTFLLGFTVTPITVTSLHTHIYTHCGDPIPHTLRDPSRDHTQCRVECLSRLLFNAQGITKVNMKHPVSVSRAILGTSPGSGLGERVGDRSLVRGFVVLSVCSSKLSAYSLPVGGESPVFYAWGLPVVPPNPGALG